MPAAQINQPSNKISLTNVSLVRLRKGKKRYELACYKNKLLEYRQGLEESLDNVLQVPTIFLSVQKAETAPKADLEKSFGKGKSQDDMVKEILVKGEIQVNAGERKELLERLEKEVVDMVQARVVDPGTKRVYSAGMIRKALDQLSSQAGHTQQQGKGDVAEKIGRLDLNGKRKGDKSGTATPDDEGSPAPKGRAPGKDKEESEDAHLPTWKGVSANRSAKSQALDAMKALIAWQPIPVMRARMRLRVTCPTSITKNAPKSKAATKEDNAEGEAKEVKGTIKDRILGYIEQVESQDTVGDEWELVGFVEPGAFKGLGEFVGGETRGRGRVEVLDMAVTHEEG
ncbi:MAG: hypothetical protein Q9227_000250 [Pyrenula ochraceoflavens]